MKFCGKRWAGRNVPIRGPPSPLDSQQSQSPETQQAASCQSLQRSTRQKSGRPPEVWARYRDGEYLTRAPAQIDPRRPSEESARRFGGRFKAREKNGKGIRAAEPGSGWARIGSGIMFRGTCRSFAMLTQGRHLSS